MSYYYIKKRGTDLYIGKTDTKLFLGSKDEATEFWDRGIDDIRKACLTCQLFGIKKDTDLVQVPVKEYGVVYSRGADKLLYFSNISFYNSYQWVVYWTDDIEDAATYDLDKAQEIATKLTEFCAVNHKETEYQPRVLRLEYDI